MTDRPQDAHWLADDAREWPASTIDEEWRRKQTVGQQGFLAGLKDRRTLVCSSLYFGLVFGSYGLGLWLPTIVDEMGDLSSTQVGFIVFVPYSIAAGFVCWWAGTRTALVSAPGTRR